MTRFYLRFNTSFKTKFCLSREGGNPSPLKRIPASAGMTLLLFLLFFLGLFQGPAFHFKEAYSAGPKPFQLKQEDSDVSYSKKDLRKAVEALLFEETNQVRGKKGLSTFQSNDTLIKAARFHSEDMFKRNYLSHFSPNGKSPLDRIRQFKPGYDESCGENVHSIFSGQGLRDPEAIARQMMKDWVGSPDHRKNIVSKEYALLGVGCATDGVKIYCTQVFSGPNL